MNTIPKNKKKFLITVFKIDIHVPDKKDTSLTLTMIWDGTTVAFFIIFPMGMLAICCLMFFVYGSCHQYCNQICYCIYCCHGPRIAYHLCPTCWFTESDLEHQFGKIHPRVASPSMTVNPYTT